MSRYSVEWHGNCDPGTGGEGVRFDDETRAVDYARELAERVPMYRVRVVDHHEGLVTYVS